MVKLDGSFDPNSVEPAKPMGVLSPGWYVMQVVASAVKSTASTENNNQYMQLDLEILEEQHPDLVGRKAWARLNLWNDNERASAIAQSELSAVCKATKVTQLDDTEQLHFKPMAVKLGVQPAKGEYQESNTVQGYELRESRFPTGGAATPSSGAASGNGSTGAATQDGEQPKAPPWNKPSE